MSPSLLGNGNNKFLILKNMDIYFCQPLTMIHVCKVVFNLELPLGDTKVQTK